MRRPWVSCTSAAGGAASSLPPGAGDSPRGRPSRCGCGRARSDRTDLEECHREPRFHIAAAVLRHDDDGQRRDHGILRDVDEEIAQAQTEEFACPERLAPYTFHGTTFRFLMVRLRAVYVTIFSIYYGEYVM